MFKSGLVALGTGLLNILPDALLVSSNMSSLTKIAEHILESAKLLDEYASAKGVPSASFDYNAFTNVPPDLQDARSTLINAAEAVRKLAMGPAGIATELIFNVRQAVELSSRTH